LDSLESDCLVYQLEGKARDHPRSGLDLPEKLPVDGSDSDYESIKDSIGRNTMTQILLYQSKEGIALATDSRAVAFVSEDEGAPRFLEIEKLFHLSPNVIAVTGGAGFGVLLCQNFERHIREAGIDDFEAIVARTLPFFRSEIMVLQQHALYLSSRPELDHMYILIAGYLPEVAEDPFRQILFASENRADPLHPVTTGKIVAIPRQLGIEYRLSRQPPSDLSLAEVELLFENLLLKLAKAGDDVGPPFYFVRITAKGITMRARASCN
jgi:hypothetical protein